MATKTKTTVKAKACLEHGKALESFEYELDEIGPEEVDIDIEYCGLCHSDLSMLQNDWGMSTYPMVAGHEVIGKVARLGEHTKGLKLGDRVGLGWFAESCMHCNDCMSGDHNLCSSNQGVLIGRHGGFANKVRCHWAWAIKLPENLDHKKAGPLFCGGITVFNPIVQLGLKPTDKVGVIGIGGLGHMALQFLNKWGCEVTAFTSSESKAEEARQLGAHNICNSRDDNDMAKIQGSLDAIINTANADLNWDAFLSTLRSRGRLHHVGAPPNPVGTSVFNLIMGQKSISATPLGSPVNTRRMLEFCERHSIAPVTEFFKMTDINDALEHLKSGKARYRVVLENNL